MSVRPEYWAFLLVLAAASLFCRFGGFWIMRYVMISPRLESTLKAAPIAVMAGIVVPAMLRGSWPEWLALVAAAAAMRLSGSDLFAAIVGVAAVALLRSGQLAG